MADRSQYGYGLDYCRMTIGPGLIFNLLLRAYRSTLRRLDFTTGKRRNRGELPKSREANSLGQQAREDEESMWDLTGHTFRVVAK